MELETSCLREPVLKFSSIRSTVCMLHQRVLFCRTTVALRTGQRHRPSLGSSQHFFSPWGVGTGSSGLLVKSS